MLPELDKHQFETVMPIFDRHFPDPMLYAVLEGRRSGRVFANNALRPTHAFVWTESESAYLARGQALAGDGSDTEFLRAFQRLILEEIIPQAAGNTSLGATARDGAVDGSGGSTGQAGLRGGL